jgi:hypothetical protein
MKLDFMIIRVYGQSSIECFNSFMEFFDLHTSVTQKVTTISVIYGITRYGLYRENKGNYKDNDSGIGWYFSWFGSLPFNKGKNFYTRRLVKNVLMLAEPYGFLNRRTPDSNHRVEIRFQEY